MGRRVLCCRVAAVDCSRRTSSSKLLMRTLASWRANSAASAPEWTGKMRGWATDSAACTMSSPHLRRAALALGAAGAEGLSRPKRAPRRGGKPCARSAGSAAAADGETASESLLSACHGRSTTMRSATLIASRHGSSGPVASARNRLKRCLWRLQGTCAGGPPTLAAETHVALNHALSSASGVPAAQAVRGVQISEECACNGPRVRAPTQNASRNAGRHSFAASLSVKTTSTCEHGRERRCGAGAVAGVAMRRKIISGGHGARAQVPPTAHLPLS